MSVTHPIPEHHPRLRISVLGPMRVSYGETTIDVGTMRQSALFAALVMRPHITVSQRELLDAVWGLEPPGTGVKVVPVYVYRLRQALQSVIGAQASALLVRDRDGYRFTGEQVWIDAVRVDELVAYAEGAVSRGDMGAAMRACAEALALFQGEPLTGLPGPFAEGERRRLLERRLTVFHQWVELRLSSGDIASVVSLLAGAVVEQPYSESLAVLLMRALYASGRRADALDVFMRTRRRLVADLGVEPGEELRRVHASMLRGDFISIAPSTVTLRRTRPRNDIPAPIDVLVGRESEVAYLLPMLDIRGVTVDVIDGVAGVGKTALAISVARQVVRDFPDGGIFLDLRTHAQGHASLTSRASLQRLLRAVGQHEDVVADSVEELAAYWRSATSHSRLLMVLDDAQGVDQVWPLLPAGHGSRVIITSRSRLAGLQAHRRISLSTLSSDDGIALLRGVVADARVNPDSRAVRGLVDQLGGLPLALRVVGSRLQSRPLWTVDYMVSRLHDSAEPLNELTAGDRSVRAAFMLSYQQLSELQRRAFRMLGAAPTLTVDPFVMAAMLEVSHAEAERLLEELVDANMLQQVAIGTYRPHNLIAAFARRLDEPEMGDATRRALDCYVDAARLSNDDGVADAPATGYGPAHSEAALEWLDSMGSDLVEVVDFAARHGFADHAVWIAEGLKDYYIRHGRDAEARAVLESALSVAADASDPRIGATLRMYLGMVYTMQGHLGPAAATYEGLRELAEVAGSEVGCAYALGGLGAIAFLQGRTEAAFELLQRSLKTLANEGDNWIAALVFSNLMAVHHQRGNEAEAKQCLEEAIARAEKLRNNRKLGRTMCYASGLLLELNQHAIAAPLLRRGAKAVESVGDFPLMAFLLTKLGTAEQGLGNIDLAIELHHRALTIVASHARAELESETRNRLGDSYLAAAQPEEAVKQFQMALSLANDTDNPLQRTRALAGLGRVAN